MIADVGFGIYINKSQIRHHKSEIEMVAVKGLEPLIFGLWDRRFYHLSYTAGAICDCGLLISDLGEKSAFRNHKSEIETADVGIEPTTWSLEDFRSKFPLS